MINFKKMKQIIVNYLFAISALLIIKNNIYAGYDNNDGNYYSSCGIASGCISDGSGVRICRASYLSKDGNKTDPSGDIKSASIMIYDADAYPGEGYYLNYYVTSGGSINELVYYKEGNTVTKQSALIPGRKYRIVSTYRYTGETMYREWCYSMGPASAITYLGHPKTHHIHFPRYVHTTCSYCWKYDEKYNCVASWSYPCTLEYCTSACYNEPCTHEAYYWSGSQVVTTKMTVDYTITKRSQVTSTNDSMSFEDAYAFMSTGNALEDRKYENIKLTTSMGIGRYTDILLYEYPWVSFSVNLKDVTYDWVNDNTKNDSLSMSINDRYDISISNLTVSPGYLYTTGSSNKQAVYFNVTYNATLTGPSHITQSNYRTLVKTCITINGKDFFVEDMLLVGGTSVNNGLSHIITLPYTSVPSSGSIPVSVTINYDRDSWESGSSIYNNNTITQNFASYVYTVTNPKTSSYLNKNVSTASSTTNVYSSSVGGRKNDNCSIPRTFVQFKTSHRVMTWSAQYIYYNKIGNSEESGGRITSKGSSVLDFYKYTISSSYNTGTRTYNEYLNISNIYFKSKETVDRGYSSSRGTGWIDILSTPSRAIVSAGYGFELEVVVKYSTNALTGQPTESYGETQTSSKWYKKAYYTTRNVTNLSGETNFGLEDLFIELPGTSSGKKVLSSTGYGSSTKALNQTPSGDSSSKTWTYTIKGTTSPSGVQTSSKIYVPENTSDASYKIRIYTPPVPGVTNAAKSANMVMCDRKDVSIIVIGSAYDDLNGHEVQ
jgi:hypothetical protein